MKGSQPDISICVITYNHELFVEKTIQSIKDQDFGGVMELIIGIDLSSDNTLEVVQNAVKDLPFTVQIINHEQRAGMHYNLKAVLEQATGKYIAMLEGDDYWYTTDKLTKQFTYMERHDSCSACGGNIYTLLDAINPVKNWRNNWNRKYFLDDFIRANRVSFCTIMFRKANLHPEIIDSLHNAPHLDWPLYISSLRGEGKQYVKVFRQPLSVYRIHSGGVYSAQHHLIKQKNMHTTMAVIADQLADKQSHRAYIHTYIHFDLNNTTVPGISQLRKVYGLSHADIPSFYLYIFGKGALIKQYLKAPWQFPRLASILIGKLFHRYVL